jgi:hypothetical protein
MRKRIPGVKTEDYLINIVPGPPCGLTNAGTATTSLPNICPLKTIHARNHRKLPHLGQE